MVSKLTLWSVALFALELSGDSIVEGNIVLGVKEVPFRFIDGQDEFPSRVAERAELEEGVGVPVF